jgi:hypothetical protein
MEHILIVPGGVTHVEQEGEATTTVVVARDQPFLVARRYRFEGGRPRPDLPCQPPRQGAFCTPLDPDPIVTAKGETCFWEPGADDRPVLRCISLPLQELAVPAIPQVPQIPEVLEIPSVPEVPAVAPVPSLPDTGP